MAQMLIQDDPRIERQRKLAEALTSQSLSSQPMHHWAQALGKLAQAYAGTKVQERADTAAQERNQNAMNALTEALSGGGNYTDIAGQISDTPGLENLAMTLAVKGAEQRSKSPDLPSGMRISPESGQAEWIPGYIEGQQQIKGAGKAETNIYNNLGEQTPGREKADKIYAEDFVKWTTGGFADTMKNLTQLQQSLGSLESGEVETGFIQGITPDTFKAATNPELLDMKQSVEEVVQRNLREILGAQFTEKEGERLISRAFDDKLPTETNIKRINRLITQVRDAALAKQEAAEYFNKYGTLTGFEGKTYSASDFSPSSMFGEKDGGDKGGDVATPTTQEEFDALPSGAMYIDPDDGKRYRKP